MNTLQFVSPESEGIKSESILQFIQQLEEHKINIHSFLFARQGKIIAEGYVKPFHENFAHRLYSSSKSFVSIAIGLLITQGKLSLQDKVADILTDFSSGTLHEWQRQMTVEDCLKMSLPTDGCIESEEYPHQWCYNSFHKARIFRPSGLMFKYGWGADFLAVVVKKITGQEFLEYLRPIFDELGISKDIWCVKAPEGHSWGGSGVVCTLRDYAKFGEFVMRKGNIAGKQWIDLDYMNKATTMQTTNCMANQFFAGRNSGYGYLFWTNPDGFAFCGLGTQYCICFPKQDFLFACQADTQYDGEDITGKLLFDWLKYFVYDKIGKAKKEGKAYLQLQEKLKNLQPPMYGKKQSCFMEKIDGKTYMLNQNNALGWKQFCLNFTGDNVGRFTYENQRGIKNIAFGVGEMKEGTFPERHYYDTQAFVPSNRELNCQAVAEWVEENKLLLRVYITDTLFANLFITFAFREDEVGIEAHSAGEFILQEYKGDAYGKIKK